MEKRKWYQETDHVHDVIVAGRIRLIRNLDNCEFPGKLTAEETQQILETMQEKLEALGDTHGLKLPYKALAEMDIDEKEGYCERRMINRASAEKETPVGLMADEEAGVSLVLEGEDHFRIQCLSPAADLDSLWKRANAIDNSVNEKFPYAFHEKYGYMTAYPTGMGTGLRAGITLHLPMLAAGKQFGKIVNEMSRFGVTVRGIYGEGNENYGSLFEVINQKTLGVTEEETIALVKQMADRLVLSERKIRSVTMRDHRLDLEDELYKSYGVLRYAKKLSQKEAMQYLSQLRIGQMEGLIRFEKPVNFYGMMLEIQPANTKLLASEENKDVPGMARAAYIQSRLSEPI